SDALADAVRFWEAVGQPHVAVAGPVGEETGPRNVGDAFRDRAGRHGLGVESLGEGHPDEEPSVRTRPGAAVRHELVEGVEHRVAPGAVQLAEALDLLAPRLG